MYMLYIMDKVYLNIIESNTYDTHLLYNYVLTKEDRMVLRQLFRRVQKEYYFNHCFWYKSLEK